MAPNAANSASVPNAIISAASAASPQSSRKLGASMFSATTATSSRIPVSNGAATTAAPDLTSSVWRRLIGTGRR